MRRRVDSGWAEAIRLVPALGSQLRVSRALGLGFALSLVWLGGVGSACAVVIGLWARHVIRASGGRVAGIRMAWWCIIVGALGTAVALAYWLIFASRMLGAK